MAMEGMIAKWYTKIRKEDEELAVDVRQIRELLPNGGDILEVAPGPGYLAIELAKLGLYRMTGLDISKSFVEIAQGKAKEAGVTVDFRLGNASQMPFAANSFDFIVCRAAFKNFSEPVEAMREMQRVLKPGGTALINDLRGDASSTDVNWHVDRMGLNAFNRWMTKMTFKTTLLKNAYTKAEIERFIAQTSFASHEIEESDISMKIWMHK
jgi:ubiquinone/menaquinone biosynthesis C-methylase UbiE